MKLIFPIFLVFLNFSSLIAQKGNLKGTVFAGKEGAIAANLYITDLKKGAISDLHGHYQLNDLPVGKHLLKVSLVGYMSKTIEIIIEPNQTKMLDIQLREDVLNLEQVVVTGTRSEVISYESPVIISNIGKKTFEQTQSLSLSEGLSFSPGLRVENNCQNCGFVQLRMNGLEGPYSQILINSRPIFSALAGVYGLEMLPTTMIDRIEVVRGGGSVLYGGNAIAGTVNIITKDPVLNSFEFGLNQGFTNSETPDRTLNVNGSIVSSDYNRGLAFYGFTRNRDPWDANVDGYSEITKQENTTFGFDAFWNPDLLSKVKLSAFTIKEFRRGGNNFHLAPHQTDLAEQLKHVILGSTASYERFSENMRHKLALYGSAQTVNRDSYYGAGGRIIQSGDSITDDDLMAINAYGTSSDLAVAGGAQYVFVMNEAISLTTGSEWQFNHVDDAMPGYNRSIHQEVQTLGIYGQLQWLPVDQFTILAGARFDAVQVDGRYLLGESNFENNRNQTVFVPRLSFMYDITETLKARLSLAQGYRAPQAFDEDLHIETVGGAARFIQLSPDLQLERSNSITASLNYTKIVGLVQSSVVLEYFYTRLDNPFILSDPTELPNGVGVITKRNGEGARVQGINLELNWAIGSNWVVQSGATLQQALYDTQEVIWSPSDASDIRAEISTSEILRTPNNYGYLTINYTPLKTVTLSYTGVYTGSMAVPHMIDPETEYTVIKQSPTFYEQSIKANWQFRIKNGYKVDWFVGVQNLTNSFQRDFDVGPDRDPAYVYGPTRPRTIYTGLKVGF